MPDSVTWQMQTPHSHLPLSLHSFPPGARHLSSDSARDSRQEAGIPKALLWGTANWMSCGQSQGLQLRASESLAHLKPPSCHWLQSIPRILLLPPLQLRLQIITCLKSPSFLCFHQKPHCFPQECLYFILLTFLTTLASSTFPSGISGIYAQTFRV